MKDKAFQMVATHASDQANQQKQTSLAIRAYESVLKRRSLKQLKAYKRYKTSQNGLFEKVFKDRLRVQKQ